MAERNLSLTPTLVASPVEWLDAVCKDFDEFLKRLSVKVGGDRQLVNKALRKYFPSVSVEKITKLSKGGALTELAQIMCYEEED